MSKKNNNDIKVSIWSELKGASVGVGIGLIVIIIVSVAFYIFMNLSPAKKTKVDDFADIFSEEEEERINEIVKKLSRDKDINVVVVTTRNKGFGYGNSDADCKKYAGDYYMQNVNTVPLQNNSGVCLMVDLTIDEDGQRFFWLYTYGSAHFAVSNDECSNLFYSNKEILGKGEYGQAIINILERLDNYTYEAYGVIVIYTIIGPLVAAWFITKKATPSRKLDPAPAASVYKARTSEKLAGQDKFIRETVVRYESSSGSSGGSFFGGGGGGGFSGGGGGGGFSGGGGGRF